VAKNPEVLQMTEHIRSAYDIANSMGIRNLFYNEGYVDLLIADALGHTYNTATQGPDGFSVNGDWCEYKTINAKPGKDGKPSWSGGTFQFHWLSKSKIEKYEKTDSFYFVLRDGVDLMEIWSLPSSIVCPLLRQKAIEKGTLTEGKKKTAAHFSLKLSQVKELGGLKEYPCQ